MFLVNNVSIIYREESIVSISNGGVKSLNNYNLIEVLNSTSSLLKNPLDLLSYKYILDLKDTKLYIGGSICYPRFL